MRLNIKPSKRSILAILIIASVITSLMGPKLASRVRSLANYLLPQFGDGAMYFTTSLQSHFSGHTYDNLTPAEVEQVKSHNDYLRGSEAYWRNLASDYRRQLSDMMVFERLYGPVKDLSCELVSARVAAADSLPYGKTRLVNAGSTRDVNAGFSVTTRKLMTDRSKAFPEKLSAITSQYLVGRIIETGRFSARLQLVSDLGFEIPARISRDPRNHRPIRIIMAGEAKEIILSEQNATLINTLVDVYAVGDGKDGLIIKDVPAHDNIMPGDVLVTCSEDEFLPIEMQIGEVQEVKVNPADPRLRILRIRPYANLEALRNVYIVVPLADLSGNETARR